MSLIAWSLILLALPLAAFVVQLFVGRRLPRQGDFLPTLAMGGSWLISLFIFGRMLATPGGLDPVIQTWPWVSLGQGGSDLTIRFGLRVDNLTAVLLVVVTTVSFLVHVYSIGYMRGDKRYSRFFAYLALFSFSMLGLVLSESLFFLFIFWELVGVCSYFLIGFYFEKPAAARAALKAFITNRVGDAGLLLGIIMVLGVAGSFDLTDLYQSVAAGKWDAAGPWGWPLWVIAGLIIFLGPVAKSAQFPLHVWLPDAMEGPTPVSALIHAATMVVAGVFLVARLLPFLAGPAFFRGDPYASPVLCVIAGLGAFTAFFAATIALVQTDIKKVLAYSTVSQLGYMMLGLGVGSLSMAIFHLFTHAFFKACLFLGAGSVIHAVHTNEMTEMGGLRRKLPITWFTFLIATLALAGMPFLSGFYSKEGILVQALAWGTHRGGGLALAPYILGLATAALTAFYMFRCVMLTFLGRPRDRGRYEQAHESPPVMTLPLLFLAGLSVFAALLVGGPAGFAARVQPDRVYAAGGTLRDGAPLRGAAVQRTLLGASATERALEPLRHQAEAPTLGGSLAALGGGLALAWLLILGAWRDVDLKTPGTLLGGVHQLLGRLYYVDFFYQRVVAPAVWFAARMAGFFDRWVLDVMVNLVGYATRLSSWLAGRLDYLAVDGAVRGTGWGVLSLGRRVRALQTGRLQDYLYLTLMLAGVLGLVLVFAQWSF